MAGGSFRIGTSGFTYPHWRGPFYPKELRSRDWLAFYAERFDSVELNNTFYRLPSRSAVERWREETPRNFSFAAKGSRFITHMKKLKDPKKSLKPFFDALEPLGGKLGPVLFQLPPAWRSDRSRLEGFLDALPRERRFAFEFRDPSWFVPDVLSLLESSGAAFCIYEIAGRSSPSIVTSDWVYLRLHGPGERAYQGSYSEEALKSWADRIREWNRAGYDVHAYFDNDQEAYAAHNALRLLAILGRPRSSGARGDLAPEWK